MTLHLNTPQGRMMTNKIVCIHVSEVKPKQCAFKERISAAFLGSFSPEEAAHLGAHHTHAPLL